MPQHSRTVKKMLGIRLNPKPYSADSSSVLRSLCQGGQRLLMQISFVRYLVVLLLLSIVFCRTVIAERPDSSAPSPSPSPQATNDNREDPGPSLSSSEEDGPMGYVERNSEEVTNVGDQDILPGSADSDSDELDED